MNENISKRNDLLSGKVIKGLTSRNMTGYYAKTKEEALHYSERRYKNGVKILWFIK